MMNFATYDTVSPSVATLLHQQYRAGFSGKAAGRGLVEAIGADGQDTDNTKRPPVS